MLTSNYDIITYLNTAELHTQGAIVTSGLWTSHLLTLNWMVLMSKKTCPLHLRVSIRFWLTAGSIPSFSLGPCLHTTTPPGAIWPSYSSAPQWLVEWSWSQWMGLKPRAAPSNPRLVHIRRGPSSTVSQRLNLGSVPGTGYLHSVRTVSWLWWRVFIQTTVSSVPVN